MNTDAEKKASPIRVSADERYTLLTKACKTERYGRRLTYEAAITRAERICFLQMPKDVRTYQIQ